MLQNEFNTAGTAAIRKPIRILISFIILTIDLMSYCKFVMVREVRVTCGMGFCYNISNCISNKKQKNKQKKKKLMKKYFKQKKDESIDIYLR